MIISGIFIIKCNKCGKLHDFSPEDTDFQHNETNQKSMGPEQTYTWENEFTCDCGQDIGIEYNVYEYPEGACNHQIPNVSGGIVKSEFTFDFSEQPHDDEYDGNE